MSCFRRMRLVTSLALRSCTFISFFVSEEILTIVLFIFDFFANAKHIICLLDTVYFSLVLLLEIELIDEEPLEDELDKLLELLLPLNEL